MIGTVLTTVDPALVELAAAPWDFVWLDMEHGAIDRYGMQSMLVGATAAGTLAFVRVPSWDSSEIGPALDAGAAGVVIPQVESVDQAAAAVSRTRIAPSGIRGVGQRRLGTLAARAPRSDPRCWVQIESRAGVKAAAGIAATDGVDAVVVGTADLAAELGHHGDALAPEVVEAVRAVGVSAHAAGVPWGVAAGSIEVAARLVTTTGSIATISTDLRLFRAVVDETAAAARARLATSSAAG